MPSNDYLEDSITNAYLRQRSKATFSTACYGPVQESLPSLDQFDHMIVFVPGSQGGLFIDTTQKFMDPMNPIPDEHGGKRVLILDSLKVGNLENLREPVEVCLRYVLVRGFHEVDDKLVGTVPAPWKNYYLDAPRYDTRKAPLRIRFPLDVESTVEICCPKGYRPDLEEAVESEGKSEFMEWTFRFSD